MSCSSRFARLAVDASVHTCCPGHRRQLPLGTACTKACPRVMTHRPLATVSPASSRPVTGPPGRPRCRRASFHHSRSTFIEWSTMAGHPAEGLLLDHGGITRRGGGPRAWVTKTHAFDEVAVLRCGACGSRRHRTSRSTTRSGSAACSRRLPRSCPRDFRCAIGERGIAGSSTRTPPRSRAERRGGLEQNGERMSAQAPPVEITGNRLAGRVQKRFWPGSGGARG
jgi:hypothetical protein